MNELAKIIRHYEDVSPFIVRDSSGKFEAAFRSRESAMAYARKLRDDFGASFHVRDSDGEPCAIAMSK